MVVEAIVSKLNAEAIGKAVSKSSETVGGAGQGTSFREVMSQIETGADFADMMGIGGTTDVNPTNQVQSLGADAVSFTPTEETTGISKPAAGEKVLDLLGEVNKGQMQMDGLVNHILYSGKKFSNQELLVIQAHVFHFAQMTELTVKVAEQGVSSMKSILNTQVQ